MALLTTLPIAPNVFNSPVGAIPQPFKGEEVKQDVIPPNTQPEDVLIKNIDKEVLDKAFQFTNSNTSTVGGGDYTHTHSFSLANVKIINCYLKYNISGPNSTLQFPLIQVKVNGTVVRSIDIPLNATQENTFIPLAFFDNDVFVGTEISFELTFRATAVLDYTTEIYVEGYQLQGYTFTK